MRSSFIRMSPNSVRKSLELCEPVILNLFRAVVYFEEPQILVAQFLAVAHFDYV